jgi:hypothetical protein
MTMGTVIAVVVGYVLGARAGQKGYEELVDAWETIRSSDEVRDLMQSGVVVAKELLARGFEVIASNTRPGPGLRPAA